MVRHAPLGIVFFGTPDFAVPTLRALAGDDRYDIRVVVTQPDRPAGRGQRLTPPPVKLASLELGLPVYQPHSLKSEADRTVLRDAAADFFVVAAFGLIFGRKTLEIPRLGCVNVHASLLPRYRGASPIAAAIACGEDETGISLMKMDAGLDTGPEMATTTVSVAPSDTTESLTSKLSTVGAALAVESLARLAAGEIAPEPQPLIGASVTRPLKKADGWLDWSLPAVTLERWVRAMWPWPRAWTTLDGQLMQVHQASIGEADLNPVPGTAVTSGNSLAVSTGEGTLILNVVQLAGGKAMPGSALVSGGRIRGGAVLGATGGPAPQPPLVEEVTS